MPNHVINRLTFDCPEDRFKQILSEICYDNNSDEDQKGIGTIDFNKITPMPESLNIECGSNTDDGINLYLRLCSEFSVNARFHDKTVHILRSSEPEAEAEPPPLAARSVLDRLA